MKTTKSKKAVSALIATVLIVGITIAAFGIVYSYIIPIIREGIETSKACADVTLSIGSEFTSYDAATNDLSVNVLRGSGEGTLAGMQIKITGTTGTSITMGEIDALGPNEGKTYTYISAVHEVGVPYSVAVAPIVTIGNKDVNCDLSPEVYVSAA